MTKLEELIKELCPNGVEYFPIENLCNTVTAPTKLKTNQYLYQGQYPIIDQGQEQVVGYTNNEQALLPFNKYVLFGDHTREVKYINGKFAQGADGLKILRSKSIIVPKYLYYCMSNFKVHSRGYSRHWGLMKQVQIPLPPLAVQCEIVRILDDYTEQEKILQGKLQEELDARRKQYEYYRDRLLSFDKLNSGRYELKFLPLERCCEVLDNKRKPITESKRIKGSFPYYGANGILDYVAEYLFDGEFVLVGEDGSVINQNGNPIVTWATGKIWVNNAHIIQAGKDVLLRYLYHYLHTVDITRFVHGNIPKLTGADFRSISIPVPPLEVQAEIVKTLDKFDKLCNDLSGGLPAEIQARKKQYEYYRDKLLTFQPI